MRGEISRDAFGFQDSGAALCDRPIAGLERLSDSFTGDFPIDADPTLALGLLTAGVWTVSFVTPRISTRNLYQRGTSRSHLFSILVISLINTGDLLVRKGGLNRALISKGFGIS